MCFSLHKTVSSVATVQVSTHNHWTTNLSTLSTRNCLWTLNCSIISNKKKTAKTKIKNDRFITHHYNTNSRSNPSSSLFIFKLLNLFTIRSLDCINPSHQNGDLCYLKPNNKKQEEWSSQKITSFDFKKGPKVDTSTKT